MKLNDGGVLIRNVVVVWDGVTSPKPNEITGNGVRYELSVLIPEASQDFKDVIELATSILQRSVFKGVLPAGGHFPGKDVEDATLLAAYPGTKKLSMKTNFTPKFFDQANQILDPMQLSGRLYNGCRVDVIIDSGYAFNNKAKGVALNMNAIRIVDNNRETSPEIETRGGMSVDQMRDAFGGGAATTAPTPHTAILTPPTPPVPPTPPAGPVMTDLARKSGYTYEALKAAGWSDDQMRSNGYLQ